MPMFTHSVIYGFSSSSTSKPYPDELPRLPGAALRERTMYVWSHIGTSPYGERWQGGPCGSVADGKVQEA